MKKFEELIEVEVPVATDPWDGHVRSLVACALKRPGGQRCVRARIRGVRPLQCERVAGAELVRATEGAGVFTQPAHKAR